jgi:hypothetical protein
MEADFIESNSGFPNFDNVKPEVWAFQIGGYQVCQKWLKDRKGRILNYEDCEHYLYILAALENTMALMTEIDEVWSPKL